METEIAEIAPDIYRLSTFITEANFMFNQFLVLDEKPLLFHTGPRALFPLTSDAVARWRGSSPSTSCAGSHSATSKPTSAAR